MDDFPVGLWVCDVCGETFPEDGSGLCPFCGSDEMSEADVDEADQVGEGE